MRCPCCGKEMEEVYVDTSYTDLCWGEVTPDGHYAYKCKECKITYDEEEGWTVPSKYKPTITDKQINYLCYLYGVFRYEYPDRSGLVSIKYTPHFDRYIPEVMSERFASTLISDKIKEEEENRIAAKKEAAFHKVLRKYNIDPCYTENGYYIQRHDTYKVMIRIDFKNANKNSGVLVHTDDVVVQFSDIFTVFDQEAVSHDILSLADELGEIASTYNTIKKGE